jgi:hypothetical protein
VENGATLTAPKVNVEASIYAPDFQGAAGLVAGAAYVTKIKAAVEFDTNELQASKLAARMPGSTSVVGTAATKGGGLTTTISAAVAVGATTALVVSATGLAAGAFLKFGIVGETEVIQVAPSYTTGLSVPLVTPFTRSHRATDAVLETVDAGTTITTWRIGRVPTASFQDVILIGNGVDGRHLKVTVKSALGDGKLSIEMSDSAVAGSHVVMTGYVNGSDPTLCPVSIEIG